MADQISPKIINYLKNEKEFLIPIRKIWLNVLTVEERFKISFDKLVSRLETDDRFRVFKSSINEDIYSNLSSNEVAYLKKELEAKGFYSGPRVWLKERTPTKEEIFNTLIDKSQASIDALVQAWDYRNKDSEDQLLDLMREMKKLQNHLKDLYKAINTPTDDNNMN